MFNYSAILPATLLDILSIFFLEGIIFYLFLFPMEEDLVSKQMENSNNIIKQYLEKQITNSPLEASIRNIVQEQLNIIKDSEKQYIKKAEISFLMLFGLFCAFIILCLIIYNYICSDIFHIKLNWSNMFIALFFIVLLIIGFETIYFFKILLNKKINDKKVIKYFLNELNLIYN